MASTYSTNLALELIGTGEQSGTWGVTTNTNLGTLLEQAISGYVTQAITDGADTTITIPNGATGVARNMFIEMTGALTAARNLIVPANKKLYFIYNNTTGGYAVTVKVSGQTGVSVPNGKKVILVSNGTDVVNAENYIASLSVGALTSGRVPYASTAGLFVDSASLTYDGTTLTATTGANFATSSGSVGIGTTSPSTKLEVAGAAKLTGTNLAIVPSTATNAAYVVATNTGGNFFLGIDTSTGASFGAGNYGRVLYSSAAYPMAFFTNDTERMRIDSSGNLGIGTTSPTQKLTVDGSINITTNNFVKAGTANIGFGATTSVTTSAAVIYGQGLSAISILWVSGNDGSNFFLDNVALYVGGAVKVISQTTMAASPAARTYSNVGNSIALTMASGTYSIKVYPIEIA